MTGQAVTTNPLLIMVINMTIVFGVLLLLGYVIRFLHWIDPTRKKAQAGAVHEETGAIATSAETDLPGSSKEEKELAAVLTTAIMAYGYKDVRIASIKKV